ncbi:MAG: hypothetical protein EHM35_19380 [Planctomycetaceae bacterium]|nr:MAG: hypothetical protein EHM35_19380 [Planctomycetaceae bacterium]
MSKAPKWTVDEVAAALKDSQDALGRQKDSDSLTLTVFALRGWAGYTQALLNHYRILDKQLAKALAENRDLRRCLK